MSELQLAKVQRSFRRSLNTYDENAYVQLEIAQTLIKILHTQRTKHEQLTHFDRVFEIGCGTGFLTNALLGNFDVSHLILNDLVAECELHIDALLSNITNSSGLPVNDFERVGKLSGLSWEFIAGDINVSEIKPEQDLICSASSLQWVNDIPALLDKIHLNLSDDGCLALSSFGPNHFSELSELNKVNESQQQLNNIKSGLSYINQENWLTMLGSKFSIQDIQTHTITLWFDSFDELLKHLRNTGVNGNASGRWSQRIKQDFSERYEALFSQKGKLPLSYEPVFIVANKA